MTKCFASTVPDASASSYWNVASNVFDEPASRSLPATRSNGSGSSTRIAGVTSSKSLRVCFVPFTTTVCRPGNWVSV